MKKVILIMLVSVLSAGMNLSIAQTSQEKTRQQVIEELKQARANGDLEKYNSETFPNADFKSTKTRAEVIAELKEYKKTHPLPDLNTY